MPKSLALKIIQEIIFSYTSKNNMIVVLGWTLKQRSWSVHHDCKAIPLVHLVQVVKEGQGNTDVFTTGA